MPGAAMGDVLDEPVLLEGAVVLDGEVDGEVEGMVDGGLIGAGAAASSTFLPQAPSANRADRASDAAATDFKWVRVM